MHALWECSEISVAWDSVPELQLHQVRNFHAILDLILYAHKKIRMLAYQNVSLLAMILQSVWYHRNQLRTTKKDYPASQVTLNAQQALMEFHRANQISGHQSHYLTPAPHRVRQRPPLEDTLKVNFDRATFKDIGKAGLGIVIRNSQGQAIASFS